MAAAARARAVGVSVVAVASHAPWVRDAHVLRGGGAGRGGVQVGWGWHDIPPLVHSFWRDKGRGVREKVPGEPGAGGRNTGGGTGGMGETVALEQVAGGVGEELLGARMWGVMGSALQLMQVQPDDSAYHLVLAAR